MPKFRLTEERTIEILEEIAEHGRNQAAQIAAIKQLELMRKGEVPVSDGFAALDGPRPALKAV